MSEWKAWCRAAADMKVHGDGVDVTLPDGRAHRVTVGTTIGGWSLIARVATRGAMAGVEDSEVLVWTRNRVTQLVGFRLDKHDLLVGESWVPEAGLGADEFIFHVRHLAAECDRLEALLTGADVE